MTATQQAQPTPAGSVGNVQIKPLSAKAMLVKLTTRRPTTARREKAAEAIIQAQMGDSSLTVSSHIFRDKHNPVRKVLNEAGAVYAYHMAHTMAWQDRGPRILPVQAYDKYSEDMRRLVADVDSAVHNLAPIYDGLVQKDIDERLTAAITKAQPATTVRARESFADEYPSYADFKERMKFEFLFMPLPDTSHFLFDINEDDKAALAEQVAEAERRAKDELTERMKAPLLHLIEKLKKNIGTEGAIFRDSAVENIVEECAIVETLAMGDATLLAMVAEVRKAIRPHALAPNQLRESPVVRAEAAAKLEAVASRMAFLMDN